MSDRRGNIATSFLDSKGLSTVYDTIQGISVWAGQVYLYLRKALAGETNEDDPVSPLDLCIVAEQWMQQR